MDAVFYYASTSTEDITNKQRQSHQQSRSSNNSDSRRSTSDRLKELLSGYDADVSTVESRSIATTSQKSNSRQGSRGRTTTTSDPANSSTTTVWSSTLEPPESSVPSTSSSSATSSSIPAPPSYLFSSTAPSSLDSASSSKFSTQERQQGSKVKDYNQSDIEAAGPYSCSAPPDATCEKSFVDIDIVETDDQAAPELDSITSSVTMPKKKQVQRKKQKNPSKWSTQTISENEKDDDTDTATEGGHSSAASDEQSFSSSKAPSTNDFSSIFFKPKGKGKNSNGKHNKKGKQKDQSSRKLNLSWILGMIFVSAFVAIAAVVMVRTARGADNTSTMEPSKESSSSSSTGEDTNSVQNNNNNNPTGSFTSFDGVARITNRYRVVEEYNHDTDSFTQGLLVHNGQLIESTGMYGDSLVRRWDPVTGDISEQYNGIDAKYFGEGMTWYADGDGRERFIMLTWREQTAFIFDATHSLGDPTDQEEEAQESEQSPSSLLSTFEYATHTMEGWGITFDPKEQVFYVSDGSEYIMVWNLHFEEIRRFAVSITLSQRQPVEGQPDVFNTQPLHYINELEWDESSGTILANVLMQNAVVRILPHSGKVAQVYDFSRLYTNRTPKSDVMNGIAKHPTLENHYWVTGKYWPKIYLVELLE